jgi:hypothetical protein
VHDPLAAVPPDPTRTHKIAVSAVSAYDTTYVPSLPSATSLPQPSPPNGASNDAPTDAHTTNPTPEADADPGAAIAAITRTPSVRVRMGRASLGCMPHKVSATTQSVKRRVSRWCGGMSRLTLNAAANRRLAKSGETRARIGNACTQHGPDGCWLLCLLRSPA